MHLSFLWQIKWVIALLMPLQRFSKWDSLGSFIQILAKCSSTEFSNSFWKLETLFSSCPTMKLNQLLWKGLIAHCVARCGDTLRLQNRSGMSMFCNSYTHTIHSSSGGAPDKINVMNAKDVWGQCTSFDLKRKKPRYKADDLVRISKRKKNFDKGYWPNWTREIFKIMGVYKKPLTKNAIQD